jgi:hypothetical protein
MKTILLAAGATLLLSTAAFAADLGAELSTAQTHAGLAAKGADITAVHMHMHHALNCLVGPAGDGYDATNANPCAKSGAGAIPDSTDAAQKAKLQTAVGLLKTGLASSDMAAAATDATDASAAIAGAKS